MLELVSSGAARAAIATLWALVALAVQPLATVAGPPPHGNPSRMSQPTSPSPVPAVAPRATASPAPATTATPPLVVRGTDNGVWEGGGAGGWFSLGGQTLGTVAAVSVPTDGPPYFIFIVTGLDHDVWASAGNSSWSRLSKSPVYCQQGPAATVSGGVLHVGCQGADQALWTASATVTAGSIPILANWGSSGGVLVAQPAAATMAGAPYFFVTGTDSRMWEYAGGSWSPRDMQCYGQPAAGGAGVAMVAGCRGLDNSFWYEVNGGSGWSPPQGAGGVLADELLARPVSGGVVFDVAAPDRTVWEATVTGAGPSGWQSRGGQVALTMTRAYLNDGIPYYAQTMALDCETASLQAGLAAYGHDYSQSDLFNQESPDLRRAYWDANGALHWGDPYTNFVGNVNGAEGNYTGYGIYYPPIVNIAHGRGLPGTTGGEALHPVTVYNAVAAGHPVEVWVEYHWTRPVVGQWIAFDGRAVSYTTWEHTVMLTAVSDTDVRVSDPAGGVYWVSRATFEASWHDFDDMAVIFQ